MYCEWHTGPETQKVTMQQCCLFRILLCQPKCEELEKAATLRGGDKVRGGVDPRVRGSVLPFRACHPGIQKHLLIRAKTSLVFPEMFLELSLGTPGRTPETTTPFLSFLSKRQLDLGEKCRRLRDQKFSGRASGDGTKVTERVQNADFRRKLQIFAVLPLLLEIQAFGGRRKPASQKSAGNRRLGSVTLGPSLLARP